MAAGQEIGQIPPAKNIARRKAAAASFRAFCESYFPVVFYLPWSDDHLRVISKIERTVIHGDQLAVAMPRGFGKTKLCEVAVVWAALTGRHRFVVLIAATADLADSALSNIKTHLSSNPLLLEDFPEAVYPIRKLESESRRCVGQRCNGKLTNIGWSGDQVVLPTVDESPSSGVIIRTAGIQGSIRGANYLRPEDGQAVRPSLAIIDDPQTDQSAKSFLQIQERLAVINGAVLGLAGPGRKIAVIIPCTVIQCGDLADQLLDRERHPEWHGERTKLVYQFPTNDKLWAHYARLRAESLRADGDGSPATEFYREHRAEMDEGARVAWPDRYNPDEISAIQNAMNLKLRNEAAFFAEYQNEPLPTNTSEADQNVPPDMVKARLSLIPRGTVPLAAQCLTAGIDVHDEILYWLVVAWADGFTGWIVDYGAWPDQRRAHWQHEKPNMPLSRKYPGAGAEAAVRQGVLDLVADLCGRTWLRQGGGTRRIDRLLVDIGFRPDQVCEVCRVSPHTTVLTPSRGLGITATRRPLSEYTRRPGDRPGWHWYQQAASRGLRTMLVDTNHWKSFLQARWRTAVGDAGSLSLFGDRAEAHEFFAAHVTSEVGTRVTANGRTVEQWAPRPGADMAHWLDCLVMASVAASYCGVTLAGVEAVAARKTRIKLSELQKGKR